MEINSKSAAYTKAVAAEFSKRLTAGSVIAFSGDLGAGKTCFTDGLCDGLGCTDYVSSPTFAIVNVYGGGRLPVYHFDMYRISGWDDLETTGYYDCIDRKDGVTVVEWSENISAALPDNTIYIELIKTGDNSRLIKIDEGRNV